MKKPSSRDRGEFRAFYAAMIDDPAFPDLDAFAFKLLFALKMSLSAVGIGVVRPGSLMDCLACTAEQLERGLRILEAPKPGSTVGWIRREQRIVWIINGLHFESSLYPNNPKHRAFISRSIKALGDAAIVAEFRAYYKEWFEGVSEGYRRGIEGPSNHSDEDRTNTPHNTETPQSSARGSLPKEFQADFDQLIDRLPVRTRLAWEAEIQTAPDRTIRENGKNLPPPTPMQIGEAIRDYNGNGEEPNLAHFRGYLRRSTAGPRGGPVRSGKKGPKEYDYSTPTNSVEDVKWAK